MSLPNNQEKASLKPPSVSWVGLTGIPRYQKLNEFAGFTATQGINSGNNCAHSPLNPVLHVACPYPEDRSHHLIKKAVNKLTDYYHHPDLLPTLNRINNSDRTQRSEARESAIQAMVSLMYQVDLVSLRVFKQRNLTHHGIAKQAQISPRRAGRALNRLSDSALIKPFQRFEGNREVGYSGVSNGYTISKQLFAQLGLKDDLARVRKGLNKHRLKLEFEHSKSENELNQKILLNQVRKAITQIEETNNSPKRSKASHREMSAIDLLLKKPP